jgi:tRNA threonylcarbamoyladenosine biosynthesis protein TsaB
MRILAVDTCLAACQVAVVDGDRVLASLSEPMMRGHQERLASMTREAMAEAGLDFAGLDRIAVTIGPGSFTGLRVGLAFAKGLGAALSIPVAGVGALEALAAGAPAHGEVLAIIDARREQVYAQAFRRGAALGPPANRLVDELPGLLQSLSSPLILVGPGAGLAAGFRPDAEVIAVAAPDPAAVAGLAMSRAPGALSPLYLRAPDARRQDA